MALLDSGAGSSKGHTRSKAREQKPETWSPYELLVGGRDSRSEPRDAAPMLETEILQASGANRPPGTGDDQPAAWVGLARQPTPEERAAAETARQRHQRLGELGVDGQSLLSGREIKASTDRMTRAEYNALSPAERAAVDFNGELVRAVRKDTRLQKKYEKTATPEERETYDADVELLFGPDRGSETYAPETVAVLRQLDFSDTAADLDDFLNLSTAITVEDLSRIDTGGGPLDEAGRGRLELQQGLAQATADLRETLARGNQLLQNFSVSARTDRLQHVDMLGGSPGQVNPGLGFGPPQWDAGGNPADLNTYFQQAFDILADRANAKDRDAILTSIGGDLRPEEAESFWRYVDKRTRRAGRYDLDLGIEKDTRYHSAEQLRQLLGMDGKASRDG